MKNKLKKHCFFLLGIIIGILISTMAVYAVTLVSSKQIEYDDSKTELDADNVETALKKLEDKLEIVIETKSLVQSRFCVASSASGTECFFMMKV